MARIFSRNVQFSFAGEGVTFAVRALILANAAVFAAQLVFDVALGNASTFDPPGGSQALNYLVYSNGRLLSGWAWTPFTYLFLHAGLWHLFMNMLQLYFFGPEVERLLGTRQFIRFYFVCGVAGALCNLLPLALGQADVPILGASGAVLGVLVAFAVVDPDRQLFMLPLPFPITARALVILLVLLNVLQAGGPVSVTTHLGGMAAGFAYMKLRPLSLRWSWERRTRRASRAARSAPPPPSGEQPPAEDEKKLADAVNNIFRFQDREK